MDWARYKAIVAEYDAMGAYATRVSDALIGLTPSEPHRLYAEKIFVKLLAHCISLRQLSPDPERRIQQELWDLSSTSVIARSIIEAFDALMYISLHEVEPIEREFRLLLWELHDSDRRRKMLDNVGSNDPRFSDVAASNERLHEQVVRHDHFSQLSRHFQKRIQDRDPPAFYNSQRDRCAASHIDFDYYNATTMQLSQYVHTLPFAIHQLFKFRAGQPDELRMMSLPLQFTLPFLARTIEGIRSLFPRPDLSPSTDVEISMAVWSAVAKRGVKDFD